MDQKHIFLVMSFLSYFATVGFCSQCIYEKVIRRRFGYQLLLKGTCANVTSDFALDTSGTSENATNLKVLILQNSKITKIPANSSLALFSRLKDLSLKSLELEEISPGAFDKLTNLAKLDLSLNRLSNISITVFSALKDLEELDLSQNLITSIPSGMFDNLSNLTVLNLEVNLISDIDNDSFKDLVKLQTLKLSQNNIRILPALLLTSLDNLYTLEISHNPLEEFQGIGFKTNLLSIYAKNTLLKRFNIDLSGLAVSHLDLSENYLEEFDFAKSSPECVNINLSRNQISAIKNFKMEQATSIDLSGNNITQVEEIPFFVINLKLENNRINNLEEIPDSSGHKLRYLNLANNEIVTATCLKLPQLQDLELQNNRIKVITRKNFQSCSSLYRLNLEFNRIESVESGAFSDLVALDTLILSNNQLKQVNFGTIPILKHLYLDSNQLQRLNVEELVNISKRLYKVKIYGNPFSCKDLDETFYKLREHHLRLFSDSSFHSISCI